MQNNRTKTFACNRSDWVLKKPRAYNTRLNKDYFLITFIVFRNSFIKRIAQIK
jgi:hypothetical protein